MKVSIDTALQGSDEWLANRAKRYNASDLACVMGIDPNGRSRTELVQLYAIGREREFSEWVQRNILDRGHEIEASARPIIESRIGEGLYPVVLVAEVDGLSRPLGASLDGLTAGDDKSFECKRRNAALWESVSAGIVPEGYRPQCEQGMMLSGAEVCLFTVSDGDDESTISCEYRSDPELRAKIVPTWKQFENDVANYVHVEHVERPAAEVSIELPALFVHAQGEITQHNMQEYGAALTAKLAEVRAIVLVTDQDFSNAKAAASMFREQCKKLKLTKDAMLSQTVSIGEAARMMDAWHEDLRVTALQLEKDVEREDAKKKAAIVAGAKADYADYVSALNSRIGGNWMPDVKPDLAQAIKNKRTYASMQDSVNTMLANAKIEADAVAGLIEANRKSIPDDMMFLFADFAAICQKSEIDFHNLLTVRVSHHRAAEEKRREAEREQIRAEEQEKAEKAAQEKANIEQAERVAKTEAERVRVEAIRHRMGALRDVPIHALAKSAWDIEKALDRLIAVEISEDAFAEFADEAAAIKRASVARMEAMMTAAMAAEAESARVAKLKQLAMEQEARDALAKEVERITAQAAHAIAEEDAEAIEATATDAGHFVVFVESANNTTPEGEPAMPAGDGPELARPAANEPAHAEGSGATMKLGDICARLGFSVTADFMFSLGFIPVATEKNAKLYREADFVIICRAIIRHIETVSMRKAA